MKPEKSPPVNSDQVIIAVLYEASEKGMQTANTVKFVKGTAVNKSLCVVNCTAGAVPKMLVWNIG